MSDVIRKRFTPESDRVKVWTEKADDGTETDFVRVPVSSTSKDRDGDEFSEKGIESMQAQYQSGDVGMFLDHGNASYDSTRYPTKGIIGRWEGAERDGSTLYGTARLNKANEDAEWLRDYLEEDMPVGFSVGFRALDADGDRDSGFKFHDVDLLETSAVGIPSNPDGVAGMSAEKDEWREALDKELNMSDSDDVPEWAKALREDVNDLQEQIDSNEEEKDADADADDSGEEPPAWAKSLQEDVQALKEDDGDDEDDDEDDEDEEGDEEEDDDKSYSVTVSAKAEDEIRELKDAADDGVLDLDSLESKTVTVSDVESDSDEKDAEADPMEEWGF